jgi:hypothetical protein
MYRISLIKTITRKECLYYRYIYNEKNTFNPIKIALLFRSCLHFLKIDNVPSQSL